MEIFNKLFGKQNKTTLKKTYYDNGNVKEEYEENKKGELHGITNLYHENGQLKVELSYTNGIQDEGEIISYHDNGIKARQVIRLKGNLNGAFSEWHKNGQLKLEGIYNNGNPTIIKQWSEEGLLTNKEKERKPSIKEVVEQYKIDDDMPASVDTTIESHKLFKRDMTGLLAYFEEMPHMEQIYNDFTYLIRNGLSVNEFLIGANLMDDLEVRSAVKKGFGDIAGFLRDMLEIQENPELRKDYNACLEAISILKAETSATETSEAENYYRKRFENMGNKDFKLALKNISKAIELDPTNLKYYFDRGSIHIKLFKNELAIIDYTKCIESKYKYIGHAYLNRGICKALLNDIKGAEEDAMMLESLDYYDLLDELEDTIWNIKSLGYDEYIKQYKKNLGCF